MISIYVMRHGTTHANARHGLQGPLDGPENQLTEEGREGAREAGSILADTSFDLVLTSPAGRARETARLATQDRPFPTRIEPRIAEIDFGEADGMAMADWIAHTGMGELWRDYCWDKPFPGGESFLACWTRIHATLVDILAAQSYQVLPADSGERALATVAANWRDLL